MMQISPMRETRRQRAERLADTATGVLILAAIGLVAGVAGGLVVVLAERGWL